MKKIDNSVLEHIKELCYKEVLGKLINSKTRYYIKTIVENFLNYNGYRINWVKCDQENNDVYMVDSGHVKIEISEEDFSGSQSSKFFVIIL